MPLLHHKDREMGHYQRWWWFRAQYPHHRFIGEELGNKNSIHAFNCFDEEGHVELFQRYISLVDLARDILYTEGIPVIQNFWLFLWFMSSHKNTRKGHVKITYKQRVTIYRELDSMQDHRIRFGFKV